MWYVFRYLSFELPLAPNIGPSDFLTLTPEQMAQYHNKGLQLQLEQLWKGLALAVVLGRMPILPKFVCYCDKHWTQLDRCRMPGAHLVRGGSSW